jgi:probable DNA repair protein
VSVAVGHGRLKPDDIVVADSRASLPAFDRLLSHLNDAGVDVEQWVPDVVSRRVGRVGLSDRREEIDAALTWAHERLAVRPSERIAIVIPNDARSASIVRRWLAGNEAQPSAGGRIQLPPGLGRGTGALDPVVGAALDCLRLLGSSSSFVTCSRVLRSSFVGQDDAESSRRAIVEVELRELLSAQADFPSAFRYGGLAERMRAAVPGFTDDLTEVLGQLEALPRRQSATAWARFMDEALRRIGWHGAREGSHGQAIDLWARATSEFCTLTAVLGDLSYDKALDELEGLLLRTEGPIELPMAGISVFAGLDQVGPGYDAAWSVGMSDAAWPRVARTNSLLPPGLQRAHGMPFASPEATLAYCRERTAAFVARIPEVIFSYPTIVDDEAALPSSLIREFDEIDVSARRGLIYAGCELQRTPLAFEVVDDPVPPLVDDVLPGGGHTLALQAECPLRAFIEGRLRARPLERPQRGISPRLRGVLAHRALELLYEALGSKAAAGELSQRGELAALIETSADRALRSLVSVVGNAQRALAELERSRLAALVTGMVQQDLERDDFTIEALELREEVTVAGVRIRCRIDRIDCLADGRFAIIDYKTGRSVSTRGLLSARLSEPQLPLYALAFDKALGALVYATLRPGSVSFRGIWDPADVFPGRPLKLPEDCGWDEQRALWREQITALVEEIIGGDGRVFPESITALRDNFATLARACEIESELADAVAGDAA